MSSPFRYDVLHYYFGQSFMYWNVDRRKNRIIDRLSRYWLMFDVFLAKKLGRKIFMTLQGCDARLAYDGNLRNQWTMCESGRCPVYQTCIDKLDDDRRWLTTKILPICDRVFFLNPELGHVVPNGTFLPYSNVDIAGIEPVYPTGSGRPRIVHAPTNSEIKGTPLILNAVAKLKERYDFDFVLVQGATHQEAMEIYKSADIAIDQVLAGWYGGFAVEMMAMGKPVACYIRDLDMQFVPEALFEDLPVLRIHPDRLADDLEAILLASSTWSRIGERSRAFVEKWHDPEAIAEKMLSAYVDSHSTFKMSPKQAPTTI
jgi:glycosyltransferase involved in cell wall biosynthesis